jgi:DNA-binding CsgD family transcriptional regulator
MPTLSRVQATAWQRIREVAAGGHAPEDLGSRLLASISIAVPNDGQRLWTVDSSSLILNRLVAASAGDGPYRHRWLREFYASADLDAVPYFAPHELMQFGATAVAYRERQDRSLCLPPDLRERVAPDVHYHRYHDALTPIGGSIRLCLRVGPRWVGMLDTVRREARPPLAPTDFAFLRLIGPTVARSLDASLAREQALLAHAPANQPDASGVLLLTPERRVLLASPAAETWLRLLADARREEHASLPTAVWTAAAGLGGGGNDVPRPVATVVVPSAVGLVRVEASPAGEDGSVAVVLAPVQPPGPPPIPATWPLTAQERRIVGVMLGGSSNRQLAAILHVSENTIETHLAHVYEKLGVRSRTELVGCLFREAYLPAFEAGADDATDGDAP